MSHFSISLSSAQAVMVFRSISRLVLSQSRHLVWAYSSCFDRSFRWGSLYTLEVDTWLEIRTLGCGARKIPGGLSVVREICEGVARVQVVTKHAILIPSLQRNIVCFKDVLSKVMYSYHYPMNSRDNCRIIVHESLDRDLECKC